jgi:ankyrin repeat protein
LAARAIQDLIEATERTNKQKRNSETSAALAYIYCSSLDSTKVNPSKLVGSILSQLCQNLPNFEIEQSLEKLFDRQSEAPTRQEPTAQDMQRAVISTMARFSQTFIVVDGLDECHILEDDQFEELCEFVNSLIQPKTMNSVAKVLVFSRPEYLEIQNAFGECPKIQVDAGANDDDIKQFITKKVSGKDLHVRETPGLPEEVEGTLLSGADGMFLWVDLLVKTLRKQRTAREIRAKLKLLPQGLDKVYELSMKRILDQDAFVSARALKILLWTMNAKRALSQRELLEALAIQPGMTELDDEDENIIHDDIGFAADCGDLVVLTNGHYHLLHSSLKDYLEKLPTSGSNLLEEYGLMQKDAARILGEICLTYLNFDRFKKGPADNDQDLAKLLDENPFLLYAANYWGHHVADANGLDLLDLTKSLLYSDGSRELCMQIFLHQQGAFPFSHQTTPLHLLSIFNLVKISQELPDADLMKSQPDEFGCVLPLEYAFVVGSKEMSSWLLENTTAVTVETESFFSPLERLHRAAIHDWGDIVEQLLSLGYDPEGKAGERQQTALHFAAFEGSESALIALLKAKVDVNPVDTCGQTPLLEAAESNHPRSVMLLLEAGADVNVHGWNGVTALHRAAKHGDLNIAKELLRRGAEVDPICTEGWGFRTPLHVAAEQNSCKVLELLINNGANIERPGPDGYNALLLTCSNGFPACLELLLKAGARTDARNDKKETCFHLAADNGCSAILETLFEKCLDHDLVNSGDAEGDTPLHIAVWKGKKSEARLLLENGAIVDKANSSGNSVLHAAIMEGETELGELLLDKYKADVRLKGWSGYTALHYAAESGRQDFIPLLLRAGADPNALDEELETPLHTAAAYNQPDFIKKFLEAVPTLDLAPRNKYGKTPLHVAASEGHLEVVKLLLNDDNVNSQGFSGQTALFTASCSGYSHLVKYLLENSADPDKLDDYQTSPLFASLAYKHVDIATALLDGGANPKLANKFGETALHKAAETGSKMIVAKLLDAGCDGLYATKWGITPFMQAVSSGKMDIVNTFLEHSVNGCALPDKLGRTCIHYAATAGSSRILNVIIAEEKQIAMATDCIGLDALDYAASTGQVDMIKPLRDLGIGANGLDEGSRRPLRSAALDGFYDFVCRLIGLGADVNRQTGIEEWSPLHAATARRRPLIAERLVKAGANPTVRDGFGLSSLDYAFRDPQVWEKMGDARTHYIPIELRSRMPTLRKTVQKCIQKIITQPQNQGPESQYVRLDSLDTLGMALIEMGSDASREFAKMCWVELTTPPEMPYYEYTWMCDMCLQKPLRGTRYLCLECSKNCLCSVCYPEYLKGDETPKSAPQSLKTLQKLEDDIKPTRELGKTFLLLGGWFLYEYSLSIIDWVDEKLKAYEDWEKIHDNTDRFKGDRRLGQEFLKLIKKLHQVGKENENGENQRTEENPFSTIEEELAEFFREHKPDKEVSKFICSKHEYMEIPDKSKMEDAWKNSFDASGELTAEWMLALLETW